MSGSEGLHCLCIPAPTPHPLSQLRHPSPLSQPYFLCLSDLAGSSLKAASQIYLWTGCSQA